MADVNKIEKSLDKSILDLFYPLSEKNVATRLTACADILNLLWKKQQKIQNAKEMSKDLEYSVERLVKGLASSRDAARLGYSLLLTEILRKFCIVQIEDVLQLIKEHLTVPSKQEKRDFVFGQLFAYSALIRSGRLKNHSNCPEVISSFYDLFQGKSYILNASYEIMVDIFSQISDENFKEVWPQLKKKLPADWETCSADSLWLLLLCIRLFPNVVSSKYLKNHWGAVDIFAADNLIHFKRIIKQTTSILPQLHPLCLEFILLIQERKDFNEIWTAVVDDLFDNEQKDKAYIGYELIKSVLKSDPKNKILKIVFSPKFRNMFVKNVLNPKLAMNPAATCLAEYMCNYAKNNKSAEKQIIVLKVFLQLPGPVELKHILKKKEVSLIIQHLLPDAVKALCAILKAILLKNKSDENKDKEMKNINSYQVVHLIGNLVAHPAVLTDAEWRIDTVKLLFLCSFFTIREANSEIPYCEKMFEPLSDEMRGACTNAFNKAVNSLHMRTEKEHSSLPIFLEQLIALTDYADVLLKATNVVEPHFSLEKIQDSWKYLKSMVHKLSKKSKKDGNMNQSNAFQALFLQLGLHLFQDPDHIPEMLEELHICCKNALKKHKHEADILESDGSDPPWIGVIVDILLSLMSKSSKELRSLVTYVFPLFCPFIDQNALQQILDVINPQKADEDMLVDESDDDNEGDKDVDFGSGSSSEEESDDEANNDPVDEAFKKRIQEALGPAADASDAESIVLSDSEMFKLDDALSEAFKSRMKSGHTQIKSEEKTLLNFRVRCLDFVLAYLKSDPPMHMVLMCIEPVLAAFEFGHRNKNQSHLLHKSVTVLQTITRIRKFSHHSDVSKSELNRLLDVLIPKCHQEIILSVSQKLSSLCVFMVLCHRKIKSAAETDKKSNKTPSYIKKYLSALDTFVSSGSSHMLPQFFTQLMEACPDLAWYFIEPCKTYAFNSDVRLYKRTQCLGLLSESLKFSKGQKEITDEQWCELGSSIFPVAVESLKTALESSDLKPAYVTELLGVIFTMHSIIKDRTGESPLEKYADLLPVLNNTPEGKRKKLNNKAKSLKNKIIVCLGGKIGSVKKSKQMNDNSNGTNVPGKRKSSDDNEDAADRANGDISGEEEKNTTKTETFTNNSSESKKKKHKKRKSSPNESSVNLGEIEE